MGLTVPRKDVPEIATAALPSVRQQIDAPAMAFGDGGAGMRSASQALSSLSDMANKRVMDEMETQASVRSLELSNLARRELNKFIYDPENGLLTRKGGSAQSARSDTETFLEDLKQRYTNMEGESPRVLEMMRGEMSKIYDSGMDLADRHQFTELTSYRDEQLRSRVTNNMEEQALNFNDEATFNRIQADTRDSIMTQARVGGWSPEKTQQELTKALSTARAAQFTAMVNQDKPDNTLLAYKAFQEARRRGQIGFEESMKLDSMFDAALPKAAAQVSMSEMRGAGATSADAISFVMHELEGGAQTVQDGGGISRFGINSVANPSVDVANLTAEQAAKIYQSDYWNKVVEPSMSPQMQMVAFDTAVNHGVPKAQTLIRQANGNPARLMQLRLDEYNRLATENPQKYGEQLNGWKNRLRNLQTRIGEISTAPVTTEAINQRAAQLDLQYAGAGNELITLFDRQNKALEDARKADRQALLDQVMPTLYDNNGDWTQLPPEVRARAMQNGAWEEITKFTGVSDPNIKIRLSSMSPENLAREDLNQYRTQLSQSDYLSFVTKQRDAGDPVRADGMRTAGQQINDMVKALGLNPAQEVQFRDRAESALAARRAANGDKALNREEVRATIGALGLDTTAGVKVYALQPNQRSVASVFVDGWFSNSREVRMADAGAAATALSYMNMDITTDNVVKYTESPARFIGVDAEDSAVRQAIDTLIASGMVSIEPSDVQDFLTTIGYRKPQPVQQKSSGVVQNEGSGGIVRQSDPFFNDTLGMTGAY